MEFVADISQLLSGNDDGLTYHLLTDYEELSRFECEVPSMNRVIHDSNFCDLISYYGCLICAVRDETGQLVAFFALRDDEVKTELADSYYAMEIAYLAVSKNLSRQGIGTKCIRKIISLARQSKIKYHLLTVDALSITYPKRERYEAVSFYRKCHFTQVELQAPDKDTIRMVYSLS